MDGVLEMENNIDAMLLEFEEINSTIDKYIDDIESDDDKELAPIQRNQTTNHQKSSLIAKTNKVYNGGINPPNLNPKRVTFSEEPNGIYNSGATSGFRTLKEAKYFISTGKNPNKIFVIPNSNTMLTTERMKLAHKLRDPSDEVDLVPGGHSTLLRGVKISDADYVTVLDKDSINIYDGKATKIIISEKEVLSGYRTDYSEEKCPKFQCRYIDDSTPIAQQSHLSCI